MVKLNFDDIILLHKTGHLDQAKEGYLELLKASPDNAILLSQLALLYIEEEDLDSAEAALEKAVNLAPHEPAFKLHLANVLKAKGLFVKAQDILVTVVEEYPDYAAAFNNLGTIYYAQAKLEQAAKAYQSAIAIKPDYIDAYYNLGLALAKLNKREEAMNVYRSLIELVPGHAGAKFQHGRLLMELGRYPEAIKEFNAVLQTHPYHLETESNLATSYLKLGQLADAKKHYLKAHEIAPHDKQILFNLGVISTQQHLPEEASTYYLQLLKDNPDDLATHNNLAVVYLALANKEAALQHFKKAATLKPDDKTLEHIVNMLSHAKNIDSAPIEYVKSLFDAYADHYDAHLIQSLGYVVPEELYKLVKSVNPERQDYTLLDLGCGTGLSGAVFKPMAKTLIGVDISEQMLTVASQKHIYDQLIKADILNYLQKTTDQFDLVIAADVFVYFGDLSAVITNIAKRLTEGGLLACNVEISENDSYQLTTSGRFAHSKSYIEMITTNAGFKIVQEKQALMRKDRDRKVIGLYYVFAGNSAHMLDF